jgi:hypothetical protein
MTRTEYKYSPAQEIAWLLANQRLFRGRAVKTLKALRRHHASRVPLIEIKDQKAYDALPNGAPFLHRGHVIYKGQKARDTWLDRELAIQAGHQDYAPYVERHVRVMHTDGRKGTIPASQLKDALAAGYKVVHTP